MNSLKDNEKLETIDILLVDMHSLLHFNWYQYHGTVWKEIQTVFSKTKQQVGGIKRGRVYDLLPGISIYNILHALLINRLKPKTT